MRATVFLLTLFIALPTVLPAQTLGELPATVLKDETRIWTSPLHVKSSDSRWLLPLAAGTAAFIISDHAVREDIHEVPGLQSPSQKLSNLGGGVELASASLGLYAVGRFTHHSRAAATGLLAGQAVLHSTIVTGGLKVAFNRERPNKVTGNGEFWEGGRSFPSGHAAATWAFATVVAQEYHDKPIVGISAYGVATLVSVARVGGLNHYPSDVLVGAVVGNLIGRFVLHHHGHN